MPVGFDGVVRDGSVGNVTAATVSLNGYGFTGFGGNGEFDFVEIGVEFAGGAGEGLDGTEGFIGDDGFDVGDGYVVEGDEEGELGGGRGARSEATTS